MGGKWELQGICNGITFTYKINARLMYIHGETYNVHKYNINIALIFLSEFYGRRGKFLFRPTSVGETCVALWALRKNIPLICVICGRKNRLALIYSIFNHEHHYTADDGHGEESETEPCCDDAEDKCQSTCEWGWCSLCYGWEGHNGEGDVWHVVKETTKKSVTYLSTDK